MAANGGITVDSNWSPVDGSFFSVLLWVALGQEGFMLMMNYWIFRNREDLRVPFIIVVTYPLYNMVLLAMRFFALLYNAILYLPQQRKLRKVKDRNSLPPVFEYRVLPKGKDPSRHMFWAPAQQLTDPEALSVPNAKAKWRILRGRAKMMQLLKKSDKDGGGLSVFTNTGKKLVDNSGGKKE
eukprot:GFYU01008439.1.p1 GENE.GFYU01008439.1~~GFYU01008439.1.p1  ORF type:complete len:182 (-),score=54.74 GFYU01008439.1:141-686(-)